MIHDQGLVDKLSDWPQEKFEGTVYRATRTQADPIAASISGGRWAPPPDGDAGFPVLYTSLHRDGALAEISSVLANLEPRPGARLIKLSSLVVSASQVVRLSRPALESLGVDLKRFGERDYALTQRIGAALAFLGVDGLLAPSARWECENLTIFIDNHALTERLDVVGTEEVEWSSWAKGHGLIE